MPYLITNKRAYVKRLQSLMGIPSTGKIGNDMREGIKKIQKDNGLDCSGTVDYKTFEIIRKRIRPASRFLVHRYESSEAVELLNAHLSTLVRYYKLPCRQPRGSYFGRDTAKAITLLRKVYLLPEGDYIDEHFEKAMLLDTKSIIATDSLTKTRHRG